MNGKDVVACIRSVRILGPALLVGLTFSGNAGAQFNTGGLFPGQSNLPQNDFTWTWGRQRSRNSFEDFSIVGSDGSFSCELTGKLSINSNLSRMDIREIENDLRRSNNFVQDANYRMADLDGRLELEWAILDCKKPQPRQRNEESEEE